jgi:hypothetical protein
VSPTPCRFFVYFCIDSGTSWEKNSEIDKVEVNMSAETQLLTEIRDLLLLMAEPALAQRDEKRRDALRQVVGKSRLKAEAVLLMDGARTQSAIAKEARMDQGDVSRLIKALRGEALISSDEKHPNLVIKVPAHFFENGGGTK